jgi:hypothetical protein
MIGTLMRAPAPDKKFRTTGLKSRMVSFSLLMSIQIFGRSEASAADKGTRRAGACLDRSCRNAGDDRDGRD